MAFCTAALPLAACRIEPIPTEGDASDTVVSAQPSPPRYSTDDAPLTPFRSLLQGAWSPEEERPKEVVQPIRRPPLPGLQLMVVAPGEVVGRKALLHLCERLSTADDATPPLAIVAETLQQLECFLPVDLTARREGLLASDTGLWGAAVSVPPERSAITVAERALLSGLGFVVWSALPPAIDPEALLVDPSLRTGAELVCPGAPPLTLAASAADALPSEWPTGIGASGGRTQGGSWLLGGGWRLGSRGLVRGDEDADAGVALGSAPDPDGDGGVLDSDADAGVVTVDEQVYEVPQMVFIAVRTEEGDLLAGVSGVSPAGERAGSVGDIALPSRRMMVGDDGAVLLDPAMTRNVMPDPLAALRAYERLARGESVDADTLALLPEGPMGEASPFVHYLHVPARALQGCKPGAAR